MTVNSLFRLIQDNRPDEFIKELKGGRYNVNTRDNNNNYLINYAVIFNLPTVVKTLIEYGAKLDVVDSEGHSLLYIPIKFVYLETVKILVDADKKIIGVSILDIKDHKDNTALHYAVSMKRLEVVKILLNNNAKPDMVNSEGLNALHIAVVNRSNELVKMVVDKIKRVDGRTRDKTGRTALHLASNFDLDKIVVTLLENNADPDIKDSKMNTALSYAVANNSVKIADKLLSSGADVNTQNFYGDSVLHTAIRKFNFEVLDSVVFSKINKNLLNFNLFNIDSELAAHLMFKSEEYDTASSEMFVKRSNLNFQNKDGVTPLYLLCKSGKWERYESVLVTKKLNIFIKDNDGKAPIDFMDNSSYDRFMNMVAKSYLYVLRSSDVKWGDELDDKCSQSSDTEKCLVRIRKRLDDLVKSDERCKLSYPRQRGKRCVTVRSQKDVQFCTFTGNNLDVVFGLITVLQKHKNACTVVDKDLLSNDEVCEHYQSVGIVANYNMCRYLNFEILWTYGNIFIASTFDESMKSCLEDKTKRFIVMPLGIEIKKGAHANYLLYDKKLKEVERFEPYGSGLPADFDYQPDMLDKILKNRFKKIDKDVKYFSPVKYLPAVSFHSFGNIEDQNKQIGDPGGFCALWAVWYVDQRLTYPDIDRGHLVRQLLKTMRQGNLSFRKTVRDYSADIVQLRDEVFDKVGMNINDWINGQYSDDQYKEVVGEVGRLL